MRRWRSTGFAKHALPHLLTRNLRCLSKYIPHAERNRSAGRYRHFVALPRSGDGSVDKRVGEDVVGKAGREDCFSRRAVGDVSGEIGGHPDGYVARVAHDAEVE